MTELIQEIMDYRAAKDKLYDFFNSATNKNLIRDYFKIILNKELDWNNSFIEDFWTDTIQINFMEDGIHYHCYIPIYWFEESHRKTMIENKKAEKDVAEEYELYLKLKEKFEL